MRACVYGCGFVWLCVHVCLWLSVRVVVHTCVCVCVRACGTCVCVYMYMCVPTCVDMMVIVHA